MVETTMMALKVGLSITHTTPPVSACTPHAAKFSICFDDFVWQLALHDPLAMSTLTVKCTLSLLTW